MAPSTILHSLPLTLNSSSINNNSRISRIIITNNTNSYRSTISPSSRRHNPSAYLISTKSTISPRASRSSPTSSSSRSMAFLDHIPLSSRHLQHRYLHYHRLKTLHLV